MPYRRRIRRSAGTLGAALILLAAAAPAAEAPPDFAAQVLDLFPRAVKVSPMQGEPSAASVLDGRGELVGYAFLTDRVLPIPAYSGKPITTLVAFDTGGVVRGIRILVHQEPILAVGVSERDLDAFVAQYRGLMVADRTQIGGRAKPGHTVLDGLSGATITAMVLDASVMRSLRKVAADRGLMSGDSAGGAGVGDDEEPLWKQNWRDHRLEIGVLIAGLAVLVLVVVFQDPLARHPHLLTYIRYGYLVFTLVFIGWVALGQLSVVNVLTFTNAVMHDFRWETFLMDPVLFILWAFVAVVMLLWGRGVYCGWLCPFGALQELVYKLAHWLRIPALELPEVVHERLWAVKYVIFLVLFGLSLQTLGAVQPSAEVEPFKTVFSLGFDRPWPFVTYALAMILVSAINRKFFCKYVCPLGGALAIPAKLALFDWLRRRKECGKPCQICANECEVRAIRATGEINPHECQYCLDCQVTYWNAYKCPPLIDRRRRRERGARVRVAATGMEEAMGSARVEEAKSGPQPESR